MALLLRVATAIWAADDFPPADDGTFYHTVAARIAQGLGYTWAWPDGVVTFAAHYPVGYPALVGAGYWLFGAAPLVAMCINALIGAASVWAVHDLAARFGSRTGAIVAGAVVAFHPGLVLYTPALMTEGVAASLAAITAAIACRVASRERSRIRALLGLGIVAGALILIRPQMLVFLPVLGFVAGGPGASDGFWRRIQGALLVTAIGVACCMPWTLRNCARMDRCAFVSANGGWNLLIGALPEGRGSFVPISGSNVPVECREVFAEVGKDRCFGRAGLELIRAAPLAWLAKMPAKLAVTFDYIGAAAHYLHASNASAFDEKAKLGLGAIETVWHRLTVLGALVALYRMDGPRRRWRGLGLLAFAPWLFVRAGWVAHLGLLAVGVLLGSRLPKSGPVLLGLALLAVTAATHAVFFGAGRYALVTVPLLSVLVAGVFQSGRSERPDPELTGAGTKS